METEVRCAYAVGEPAREVMHCLSGCRPSSFTGAHHLFLYRPQDLQCLPHICNVFLTFSSSREDKNYDLMLQLQQGIRTNLDMTER
ncbi:hypothetical protein EJB05_10584, partial [Eragrostis curvula]